MRKLTAFSIAFLVAAALIFPTPVAAGGVGVSPASITTAKLKPGMKVEEEITISQSKPEADMNIHLVKELGNASDWVSFTPAAEFTISKGVSRYTFKVTITVPANAAEGSYNGSIRLIASEAGSSGSGVAVAKGARMDVAIEVSNQDVVDMVVKGLTIPNVELGNGLMLEVNLENKGNVASAPNLAEIEIQDLNQQTIDKIASSAFEQVPAGETKVVKVNFPASAKVEIGEYFAVVKVYSGTTVLREDRLVFKVVAKSAVDSTDNGGTTTTSQQILNALLVFGVLSLATAAVLAVLYFRKQQDTKVGVARR